MTYYLTFGVQYAHDRHPSGHDWIAPDGFVRIEASDEETARAYAIREFGDAWAFIRPYVPNVRHYPAGELAVVDRDGLHRAAIGAAVEAAGGAA